MNYTSGAYNQPVNYIGVTVGNYNDGAYTSSSSYNRVNLPFILSKAVDIYIDQGDEYLSTNTVLDQLGNKVNLAGCTCNMVLSRWENVIQIQQANALIVDAKKGLIALSLASGVTRLLTNNRYVYSVFLNQGNTIVKVFHGTAIIKNR